MKLNKWLVNDITAQAYKDGKADGRAEAIDEFANALINDGKVSAMRVLKIKEQLKSHNYEVNKQ